MTDQLKKRSVRAFAWSAAQSWVVRFLTLLVFLVLTRYLDQEELGKAQVAMLLVTFLVMTAEQGITGAIVRGGSTNKSDLNGPFFVVLASSLVLTAAVVLWSGSISAWLASPDAEELILMASIICPMSAVGAFYVALFRKDLNFSTPALIAFVAALLSSSVAIVLAINGFGAKSIVIQGLVSALILLGGMLIKNPWRPSRLIRLSAVYDLVRLSGPIYLTQLVDFFVVRLIDIVVLSGFGVAALGIYSVGSKLYLTVLELLAAALIPVAITVLSKLNNNTEKLREVYLRLIFIASFTTAPIFLLLAVVSRELCGIIFGASWDQSASTAQVLAILGAVQAVQFFNGAALAARGKGIEITVIGICKLIAAVGSLTFFEAFDLADMVMNYVIGQLLITPISFLFASRAIGFGWRELVVNIAPGAFCSVVAVLSVGWVSSLVGNINNIHAAFLVSSGAFVFGFSLLAFFVSRKRLLMELRFIVSGFK